MAGFADRLEIIEASIPYMMSPSANEQAVRDDLDATLLRYAEPWRRHHGVAHPLNVARFMLDHVDRLHNPRVGLYLAFKHDNIYIPRLTGGLNEEYSALLSEEQHKALHGSELEARQVGDGIRASVSHIWDGKDPDVAYFLDGDMAILGAPGEIFDAYDTNIAWEYRHFDAEAYYNGRLSFLKGLLELDHIFATEEGREGYEAQAIANVKRKIAKMEAEREG